MSRQPSSSPWGGQRRSSFTPLARLLQTLAIAAVAYLAAAGVYSVIETVTSMPKGGVWDEALKVPAFFVLMIVAMVVFLVPLFRSDSDASARQFSVFAASFFVVYAILKATHYGEPDAPLQLIIRYAIEPLRSTILH